MQGHCVLAAVLFIPFDCPLIERENASRSAGLSTDKNSRRLLHTHEYQPWPQSPKPERTNCCFSVCGGHRSSAQDFVPVAHGTGTSPRRPELHVAYCNKKACAVLLEQDCHTAGGQPAARPRHGVVHHAHWYLSKSYHSRKLHVQYTKQS